MPPVTVVAQPSDHHNRVLSWLLGLHGLGLMVIFPLGPQDARLWHPGIPGIAALVAAYPLAAVIGGLLARRRSVLPTSPRTLAILACLAVAPAVLSTDYSTLFAARIVGGLLAGISLVALQRALSVSAVVSAGREAARIIAFGMPVCILAATLFDWRSAFMPILVGAVALLAIAPQSPEEPRVVKPNLAEAESFALVATGALAFVSAAYLTVLSAFLVRNAGHTELHISAALTIGAVLGLAVPSAVAVLRKRLSSRSVLTAVLAASALSFTALLALRSPIPAAFALALIGCFLAVNSARHLALAGLVRPRLTDEQVPAHQIHTHLAHHAGSGLGALCAGLFIHVSPAGGLTGMPSLLICSLIATVVAWRTGLFSTRQSIAPVDRFITPTSRPRPQKAAS